MAKATETGMSLLEFAEYWEARKATAKGKAKHARGGSKRGSKSGGGGNDTDARVLNLITLEFSGTALEPMLQTPALVRAIDWIDHVWGGS